MNKNINDWFNNAIIDGHFKDMGFSINKLIDGEEYFCERIEDEKFALYGGKEYNLIAYRTYEEAVKERLSKTKHKICAEEQDERDFF